MALTIAERTNITKLVVAMFNAAPGATYLAELTVAFEANGRSLVNLAKDLATTPAYKALNPVFQTAGEFATAFLTPLGLQANQEAVDFVVSKFNAGVSKGQIAFEAAAALVATTAPAFADAKAILNNKTAVAEYYSVTKAIAQTNLGTLQQVVSTVTKDAASVTAANTAIDNGTGAAAGNTFTLTTGIDTLVGTSGNDTFIASFDGLVTSTSNLGDTVNGGTGTDTLKVYSNAAATVVPGMTSIENLWINDTVHESRDVSTVAGLTSLELNGGISIDGATITLTVAAGQAVKLSSITDGDAAAAALADGGVSIASAASVAALNLDLNAVGAQTGATANTALQLGVAGTGVATLNVNSTGVNNIGLANVGGAITTVNVTGAGATTVWGTTAATITTFNAAAATGAVTVDLSASTGANQTITGGTAGDTITVDLARNITLDAGAGDDTVILTNATAANLSSTVGAADSIKGGDGNDTLVVTSAGAAALAGDTALDRAVITGFEQLRTSDALTAANTFNISNFGINYLQVGADTITADAAVTGFTSGATIENRAATHAGHTITVAGTVEAGDIVTAVVNGASYSFTATANTATNAAAGLAALINAGQGAGYVAENGAGVITLAVSTATAVSQTVTGADTLTIGLAAGDGIEIDVGMTGATAAGTPDDLLNIKLNANLLNNYDLESSYGVAGINKLVFTTADRDNTDGATDRNDGYVVNLTNDNAVTLTTVSGTNAFSFTSTASTAALANFTATGLAGDLFVNLATNGLTQGVTVVGGSGTNTITGTGFGDIITGGARADTITGGAGADVLTGGAGADTFVFAASSSGGAPSATVFDTITDFAKASDIIDYVAALTIASGSTVSSGTAGINTQGIATFNAADNTLALKIIAAEAGINASGTATAGQYAVFEDAGSSYIIVSDGADNIGAADVLIKLAGVTGLATSTLAGGNLTLA